MMQPLWISKDPCITEEKGKLIKWEGGGVGVCAPGFEGLKIVSAVFEIHISKNKKLFSSTIIILHTTVNDKKIKKKYNM